MNLLKYVTLKQAVGSICSTGYKSQISHLSYETIKSISDGKAYVLLVEKLKSEKTIITKHVFIGYLISHYKISWCYKLYYLHHFIQMEKRVKWHFEYRVERQVHVCLISEFICFPFLYTLTNTCCLLIYWWWVWGGISSWF